MEEIFQYVLIINNTMCLLLHSFIPRVSVVLLVVLVPVGLWVLLVLMAKLVLLESLETVVNP